MKRRSVVRCARTFLITIAPDSISRFREIRLNHEVYNPSAGLLFVPKSVASTIVMNALHNPFQLRFVNVRVLAACLRF